jgi:biotin carboxyl carrier protein
VAALSAPGDAVRVAVAPTSRHDDDPTLVVARAVEPADGPGVVVDGTTLEARLVLVDELHARLEFGGEPPAESVRILFGPPRRRSRDGKVVREVVVDGWRVEVELEPESRAALRERARRTGTAVVAGGPIEINAIIPGRIVALSIVPGDSVVAGQQVLVLEAMKMQNELRAPRDGVVERIAVAVGENVEVGDLLLVIR